MMSQTLCLFLLLSFTTQASDCETGYTICAPPGAASTLVPQLNTAEFPDLFTNIIQSSLPRLKRSDSISTTPATASLCCNALLSCLRMHNTAIPFCYDQFTTNYFLPDGSYGTIVGGEYKNPVGDVANLKTGEYTLVDGSTGNIYPNNSAPDTATLTIPTQFTGTGVGSAIPASSLGREITIVYTSTLPGITKSGSTILPSTTYSVVQETILLPTVVSGSTIAATSILTKTVPVTIQGTVVGGTTVPGALTTVTTTEAATAVKTNETKKSGAGELVWRNCFVVVLGLLVVRW